MPWQDLDEDIAEELGQVLLNPKDLWHPKRARMHLTSGRVPGVFRCERCNAELPDEATSRRRICPDCSRRSTSSSKMDPVEVQCICGKVMLTKHGRKFCSQKCRYQATKKGQEDGQERNEVDREG